MRGLSSVVDQSVSVPSDWAQAYREMLSQQREWQNIKLFKLGAVIELNNGLANEWMYLRPAKHVDTP